MEVRLDSGAVPQLYSANQAVSQVIINNRFPSRISTYRHRGMTFFNYKLDHKKMEEK